jgi:hypothetical protein
MPNRSDQEAYNELAYYTLAQPRTAFIHQHIVDAYTAQCADENSKPIGITFPLIGLYLYIEKDFSGNQVQQAHVQLAKKRKRWPTFKLPDGQGEITARDVLAAPPGHERDDAIRAWCASVWEAWQESQQQVRDLVRSELGII